jgi:membrane-associated phospholipid phosphatase
LNDKALYGVTQRIGWVTLIAVSWAIGYFGVSNLTLDAKRLPYEILTSWDEKIPCIPGMVWVYIAAIFTPIAPAFFTPLRCVKKIAMAYLGAIATSLAIFAFYPVSAYTLRMGCAFEMSSRASWSAHALKMLYVVDPPLNLFPSLHVSLCTLTAFCLGQLWRTWPARLAIGVFVLAVIASVCLVKQHLLIDVVGGLVVGGGFGFWISLLVSVSWAHSGGTDKNGCHHDHKNGRYHCHH